LYFLQGGDMRITQKWIDKHQPCKEAIEWWDHRWSDSFKILDNLIQEDKFSWANWFVVRLMNHKQKIRYAIYDAEQVIDIYEKKYPDDKRPRQAIKAAKNYLKNPSKKNKDAANAAAHAANATAYAAYAAVYAVYAANAANAAAYAAYAAMKKKILKYGIKILKEK